jgi:hypothetical protein
MASETIWDGRTAEEKQKIGFRQSWKTIIFKRTENERST